MTEPLLTLKIADRGSSILDQLPRWQNRLVKNEMVRFAKRWRKMFVRMHLSGKGEYSIAATKLASGGNFRSWVEGSEYSDLIWKAKISRILLTHEKRTFIIAKKLRGGKIKRLFAGGKGFVTKPRIHFVDEFHNAIPDILNRIDKARLRAVEIAKDRAVEKITTVVTG